MTSFLEDDLDDMYDAGFVHRAPTQYAMTSELIIHDLDISDAAVRLYAHMLIRYGSNKQNFEKRETMAIILGKDKRTITRLIKELAEHNWIVVIVRRHKEGTRKGQRTSNFYHVFERTEDCLAWIANHDQSDKNVTLTKVTKMSPSKVTKMSTQDIDVLDYIDTELSVSYDTDPATANALRASDLDEELDDLSQYDQLTQRKQMQASAHLTTQGASNTPHLQSSAKVSSPKADKPPKAPKQPKEDLSRYDLRAAANKLTDADLVLRALARALFDCVDSPQAIAAFEGRLKAILFGQKQPFVVYGLLKYEEAENNGKIDYQGIADALEGFRGYVARRRLLWGMVQSPKNFIGYWQDYRNERNKADEWIAD